ncbi:MAG: hypothetical protein ACI9BD_001275 [Candidatus Marinamargulisbacteria bacterium]|jgi:hypothetical protein
MRKFISSSELSTLDWMAVTGKRVAGVPLVMTYVAGKSLGNGVVQGAQGALSWGSSGASMGSLFGLPGLIAGGVGGVLGGGTVKFVLGTGKGLLEGVQEGPQVYRAYFSE